MTADRRQSASPRAKRLSLNRHYSENHDTIAAISTPPGRGAIGIVRLSGAIRCGIRRVPSSPSKPNSAPGPPLSANSSTPKAHVVDEVVVTYFAAPRSYTAEDVVEISCHGAPVILRHCLDRAVRAGARLAEPGEFTLRAFLNGRIDLPQAEAVRDLIDATTLYQARIAARQTQGSRLASSSPRSRPNSSN